MMKTTIKTTSKLILLLVAFSQLISVSCFRQFYPEQSFHNIETQADKKKLKDFMEGDIEKVINIYNTSPDEIIITAQKYLGVPHCMGGKTMKCMDCSGLLVRVFAEHGILLPHSSEEQARYGKIITEMDELLTGDLVFFIKSYKTNLFITHSGIYLGDNTFIHTSSKKGVTITSLYDIWWKEKFVFGTRVFK